MEQYRYKSVISEYRLPLITTALKEYLVTYRVDLSNVIQSSLLIIPSHHSTIPSHHIILVVPLLKLDFWLGHTIARAALE